MSMDPQDAAEDLDVDKIDDADDRTGDLVGEALDDYPPDEPLGVKSVGVTPVEEDARESFEERTTREEPEASVADARGDAGEVGQLVQQEGTLDDEPQELADAMPGDARSAEEAAMHVEPDPGETDRAG